MTPREAVMLCRYAKACCPQQAIDEYTPDAWHDLLGDLSLEDCREAVRHIAQRQPFVAPAEIATQVKKIRTDRLHDFQYMPVEGDDDPQVYLAALREQKAAVADGRREPAPAIEGARPRNVPALLAGKIRRPS